MINYFKRTIQDKFIKKITGIKIGSWINVVDPSSQEIEYLVRKHGLDKRNLESGLDQNELPRLDFVEDNIYIFAKTIPSIEKKEIETYLVVITKKFILTLSKTEPSFVKSILEGKIKFITTQKLKCLIRLFSLMNEVFDIVTLDVIKRARAKKKLREDLQEKDLNVLLEQEDLLNNFVSSYYHMNLLYERAVRKIKFFEQDKEIIEDLITEATQGLNLCRSSLKSMSNISNYYVVLLSNKLNRIITILTVFTIFVSFPAVISGIYGMNVVLPLQEHPFIFYYLIILVGVFWLVFIWYLKRKKLFKI